jgi:hypothetical protein
MLIGLLRIHLRRWLRQAAYPWGLSAVQGSDQCGTGWATGKKKWLLRENIEERKDFFCNLVRGYNLFRKPASDLVTSRGFPEYSPAKKGITPS